MLKVPEWAPGHARCATWSWSAANCTGDNLLDIALAIPGRVEVVAPILKQRAEALWELHQGSCPTKVGAE